MSFLTRKMSPTITDMIRFDHSHALLTFHQYTENKSVATKTSLAETICTALEIHATLEEEIFYPVLRQRGAEHTVLDNSVPEHDAMRRRIADIRNTHASMPQHAELMHALMRDVMHHVADEETVLLPQAEKLLSHAQLQEMGAQMTRRRLQLVTPQAGKIAVNTVVGFSGSTMFRVAGALACLGIAACWKQHRSPTSKQTA